MRSNRQEQVMLVGPSGTGKTLMCETLSKLMQGAVRHCGRDFARADALRQRRDRCDPPAAGRQGRRRHRARAERDRLHRRDRQAEGAAGPAAQHLGRERAACAAQDHGGRPVKLGSGSTSTRRNILFICGGAFVGLETIMSKTHGYGFISTSDEDNQNILDRLNTRVKPTDLFEFGLIPEFTGRLPIIARFEDLTRPMLVRIMTEPRNSHLQPVPRDLQKRRRRARIDRRSSSRSPRSPTNTRPARAACAASSRR